MKTAIRMEASLYALTVTAEISVLEQRPELALLCSAADRGSLTIDTVLETLPGLEEGGARCVIQRCVEFELCDRSGRLTAAGKRCAENGLVPIPEQGVYTFWAARHLLFDTRLVHFERELPDPADRDFDSLAPIPSWLQPNLPLARSALDHEVSFELRDLLRHHRGPAEGRWHELPPCTLEWIIDFDSGRDAWSLEGKLELERGSRRTPTSFRSVPESARLDTAALLRTWVQDWNPDEGCVEIDFDGHTEAGPNRFLRNITFPNAPIPILGDTMDVTVSEVPVGPRNVEAARVWAESLVRDDLGATDGYITSSSVDRTFTSTIEGTPLARFEIDSPTPQRMLEITDTRQERRDYWRIAVPCDLSPRSRA